MVALPVARSIARPIASAVANSDVDGGGVSYDTIISGASSLLNGDANLDGTGDTNDVQGNFNGSWAGGSIYAAPPPNRTGKAFEFNGANGLTQVSDAGNFTDGFTVACWIKPDVLAGRICAKRTDAPNWGFDWFLNANGTISVYDGLGTATSVGTVTVSQWNHVAIVIDGANCKFAINGVTESMATRTIAPNTFIVSWAYLAYAGADLFDGQMYQLAIWGRPLSDAELSVLHA